MSAASPDGEFAAPSADAHPVGAAAAYPLAPNVGRMTLMLVGPFGVGLAAAVFLALAVLFGLQAAWLTASPPRNDAKTQRPLDPRTQSASPRGDAKTQTPYDPVTQSAPPPVGAGGVKNEKTTPSRPAPRDQPNALAK